MDTLVTVALLAAPNPVPAQGNLWLGVRYDVAPGWQIAWESSGSAAQAATTLELSSDGLRLGAVQWPAPARLVGPEAGGANGYLGSVTLLVPAAVMQDAPPSIQVVGHSSWVACKEEICIPGEATLQLALLVAAEPSAADPFLADRARLPTPVPPTAILTSLPDGGGLSLSLPGAQGVTFFPDAALAALLGPVGISQDGSGSTVHMDLPLPAPPGAQAVVTAQTAAGSRAWSVPIGPPLAPIEDGPPVAVGERAPDFTLTDTQGVRAALHDAAGHPVVLVWLDPACPFVRYATDSGPLPELSRRWRARGVRWLAIDSTVPRRGADPTADAHARAALHLDLPLLLDPTAAVGRRFDITTAPAAVVIAADGTVAYRGALDDAPLGRVDGDHRRDYVDAALRALAAGGAVRPTSTTSYGCAVQYGDPVR